MRLMILAVCVFLISKCSLLSCVTATANESTKMPHHDKKPMSVLVVPMHAASHMARIAPLGAALVQRGHNVTFCTTEREGDDTPQLLAERAGMTWLSAGPDYLRTKADEVAALAARKYHHHLITLWAAFRLIHETAGRIAEKLRSDPVFATRWDIIVVDGFLAMTLNCLSLQWGVPLISFHTTLDAYPKNVPQWPYPPSLTTYTDDMTSLWQRLATFPYEIRSSLYMRYVKNHHWDAIDFECSDHYHEVYNVNEGYAPTIYAVAIGFEYPRSLLPMMHYVGPLFHSPQEIESGELKEWLARKPEKSVMYISLGSMIEVTQELRNVFVNAFLQTNYSVLWSLRAANPEILDGVLQDKDRFHISSWVPQQDVLRNEAIKLAVIHGGMGGVSEALNNAVPLVVIPFFFEQPSLAARVQHAGAGVYIEPDSLSTDKLLKAIKTISAPEYQIAAQRLKKIFHHAGGAERAADLVEFYQEVGYDHLIPAYLKYKWSWVQYYNVDLYAVLFCITMTTMYIVTRLCSRRCTRKVKKE